MAEDVDSAGVILLLVPPAPPPKETPPDENDTAEPASVAEPKTAPPPVDPWPSVAAAPGTAPKASGFGASGAAAVFAWAVVDPNENPPDEVVSVAGLETFASDLSLLACVDSVAPIMAHNEIGDGG